MIALILGGAPSVWLDLEKAQAQLDRRHMVVAANLAGIEWRGQLDGWASLHGDLLPGWAKARAGKPAGRLFTVETTPERWPGSSGLYALQCALFEMGATGAILCGIPMDSAAGHFSVPGSWAGTDDYRRAFEAALPEIGGRVRSMGGWTQSLFGAPSEAWIDAIDTTRPAGVTAAANARTDVMQHIKNGSGATLSFWHNQPDGLRGRIHLAPGESGDFDVDTNAPEFARDGVKVGPTAAAKTPAPKKSAAKKAAPKKAAAPRPDPAPPAPPVSEEA